MVYTAEQIAKMCANKKRLASENDAILLAVKVKQRGGPDQRVYKCPNCKKWHLTSRLTKWDTWEQR